MDTPKTLSENEVLILMNHLAKESNTHKRNIRSVRNRLLCLLMLDAGLRVGETVKLRISDLFIFGQPVTSVVVRPAISKTKHERIIPTSGRLANGIREMSTAFWYSYRMTSDMYAFQPGQTKPPPSTRQIERVFRSVGLASLGRPINPHMFRHTFASRLMRTTNARVVQQLLGHKNLTSTQIYTHPNGDDLKKAINSLEEPHTEQRHCQQ